MKRAEVILGTRAHHWLVGRILTTLCLLLAANSEVAGQVNASTNQNTRAEHGSVHWIDLDDETARQVIVDREAGQYLGHPTTVLLEDGKTMFCVYPKGHGRGAIVMKRSNDGGLSWSKRLPTPQNWSTSKETPTIHRMLKPDGSKGLLLFSGLYPIRAARSWDDGQTWTPLQPIGDFGGIVAMSSVVELDLEPGSYMALFHDDGRFFRRSGTRTDTMTLYKTFSSDAGQTWSEPEEIYASSEVHLCEPGAVRSPDGSQLAVLLRENRRRQNSHIMFSNDEGQSWSEPRPLPEELNGDRHTARYAPDGRLLISFRDVAPKGKQSAWHGDWVAWVGTYRDLVERGDGEYRIRLKENHRGADCAYPGVECLPDGTFVITTYGHWQPEEKPYILSVRLKLDELDAQSE